MDLRPGAWCGAEVDDVAASTEDVERLVDLKQLEGGAGAPPLLLSLAVVDVLQVGQK